MYRLIIAEKTSVAQSTAALGVKQRREGYLEGKDMIRILFVCHGRTVA